MLTALVLAPQAAGHPIPPSQFRADPALAKLNGTVTGSENASLGQTTPSTVCPEGWNLVLLMFPKITFHVSDICYCTYNFNICQKKKKPYDLCMAEREHCNIVCYME